MKTKSLIPAIYFFMAIAFSGIYSQTGKADSVKSVTKQLIELCKNKSYDKSALLIAYNGDDKTRQNISSYDPTKKDEFNLSARISKKISALIELSGGYELGPFSVENENGNEVYIQSVDFISGSQKLKTLFKFAKTKTGFLLTDIN